MLLRRTALTVTFAAMTLATACHDPATGAKPGRETGGKPVAPAAESPPGGVATAPAATQGTPDQAPATGEMKKVIVCKAPTGWELSLGDAFPPGTEICGAWRNAGYVGYIRVTMPPNQPADTLRAFAVRTVQELKAQKFDIDEFTNDETAAMVKFHFVGNPSLPAQAGMADVIVTFDQRLLLVFGLWDAKQADKGTAAYIEALNGVTTVETAFPPTPRIAPPAPAVPR